MKKKYLYNGQLIDESDVMTAAKQSNLSIDDYTKKAGMKAVDDSYSYNGNEISSDDILKAANESKLGFDDYIQKAGFQQIKKKEPSTEDLQNGQRPAAYALPTPPAKQTSHFTPQLNLGENNVQPQAQQPTQNAPSFNPTDFLANDMKQDEVGVDPNMDAGLQLASYHQKRNKELDATKSALNTQLLNNYHDKNVIQGDIAQGIPKLNIKPLNNLPINDTPTENDKLHSDINDIQDYQDKLNNSIHHAASVYAGTKTQDPVVAGRLVRSILGDKKAAEEQTYAEKVLPISPAAQYYNEREGLDALQTSLDAKYEDKSDPEYIAKKAELDVDAANLLNKHPEFKQQQISKAIAQQIVKDHPNAGAMGLLPYAKEAVKELGLTKEDIKDIDFDDLPIRNGVTSALGAVYNSALKIGAGAARIGSGVLGIDPDITSAYNQQALERGEQRFADVSGLQNSPTVVDTDKNSPTYLQDIANPDKGKYNYNFHTISNAIGSGIGNLAAIVGGTKGLGTIAKGVAPGLSAATEADLGMAATMIGQGYEPYYQQAKEVVSDKPSDEWKRHIYALLNGSLDYLSFKPLEGLQRVVTPSQSQELGEILKDAPSLSEVSRTKLKNWSTKVLEGVKNATGETLKVGAGITLSDIAKNTVDNILGTGDAGKKSDKELGGKILDDASNLFFTIGVPLGLGELVKGVQHSYTFKENLYNSGLHPETYLAQANDLLQKKVITQDEYNKRAQVINTANTIVSSIPDDLNLNHNQKVAYTNSKLRELALKAKADKIGDDALAGYYNAKIKDEVNSRINTISGADKDLPYTENISSQLNTENNATQKGNITENNLAEHQNGNEGGETTETGGSNSNEPSGEGQKERISTIGLSHGDWLDRNKNLFSEEKYKQLNDDLNSDNADVKQKAIDEIVSKKKEVADFIPSKMSFVEKAAEVTDNTSPLIQAYRDKTGVTADQVPDQELLKNIAEQAQNISGGEVNKTGDEKSLYGRTVKGTGNNQISKEASQLLNKIDEGGSMPAFITKNLEKIANDNGIAITDKSTAQSVIDDLTNKRDKAGKELVDAAIEAYPKDKLLNSEQPKEENAPLNKVSPIVDNPVKDENGFPVNQDNRSATKREKGKYYIDKVDLKYDENDKGYSVRDFSEVKDAKPIPDYPSLELFSHKDANGKTIISENLTGRKISEGKTLAEAKEKLNNIIKNNGGEESVLNQIEATQEKQTPIVDKEGVDKVTENEKMEFGSGYKNMDFKKDNIQSDLIKVTEQPEDRQRVDKIKNDIKANGIKEPLMVEFDEESGNFYVKNGNHRATAIKELGIKEVPVIIAEPKAKTPITETPKEQDYEKRPRDTETIVNASEAIINKANAARTEEEVNDAATEVEAALNEIESKIGKLKESYSTEGIVHDYPSKIIGKAAKKEVTKYAKGIAQQLGWDITAKDVHDNIPPAGGEVTMQFKIPGTPYEMYVAAKYEPEYSSRGGYDNYRFNGFFYRLEDPSAKGQARYKGGNQWQRDNISAKEMAEILKAEANKYVNKKTPEVTEVPTPVISKATKRLIRDTAIRKEIDDAWDDFLQGDDVLASGGLDPKRIEKGTKLIGLYLKQGIYKFSDILEDAYAKFGDKLHDYVDALKSVYSTHYNTVASDEEAAKMDASVRGIKLDDIIDNIKKSNNLDNEKIKQDVKSDSGTGITEKSSVGETAKGLASERTQEPVPADDGEGRTNGLGNKKGAKGDRHADENGAGGATQEPSPGVSEGKFTIPVTGNKEINEQLGGSSKKDQEIPKPADQEPTVTPLQHNGNFIIPPDFENSKSFNVSQKLQDNIDALKVLVNLHNEGRKPTYEEQKALFKYVGWGGIKEIGFDPDSESGWVASNKDLRPKIKEVHELLKKLDNYEGNIASIKSSVLNAHYTAIPVIRGIYNVLRKAGFRGGRIIEPSAGIGHFIGAMPIDIREKSQVGALEKDNITGLIFKGLYPNVASIIDKGYEEVSTGGSNSNDLTISNIPFGNYSVFDPNFNKSKDKALKGSQKKIHSYFFARAIEDTKPNGLISFITSTGILDSKDNADLRNMMAEKTEFLGAIRLPNDSFKGNANTSVTTDIIFLRKLGENEVPDQKHDFLKTKSEIVKHKNKNSDQQLSVSYNEYFHDNPEMILGKVEAGSMYGASKDGLTDAMTVTPTGIDLEKGITDLADKIVPHKIVDNTEDQNVKEETKTFIKDKGEKAGNLIKMTDGSYGIVSDDFGINEALDEKAKELGINPDNIRTYDINSEDIDKLEANGLSVSDFKLKKVIPVRIPKKYEEAVKDLLPLRSALNELYAAEYGDMGDNIIEGRRQRLNEAYNKFVKNNGTLLSNKGLLDMDVDGHNLLALENVSDKKVTGLADIFRKRVFQPQKRAESATDLADAISLNLSETGSIDINRLAELLKKTPDEIIKEGEGIMFKNPLGDFETKDKYLSGDVRKKLDQAKIAAAADPFFKPNVAALEAVQPKDLKASEIYAPISAPWIDTKYLNEFASHLFKQNVLINKLSTGRVNVDGRDKNTEVTDIYGTKRRTGFELLEEAMQNRMPIVTDVIDKKTVVNAEETQKAAEKVNKIKEAFDKWIWMDDARRNALTSHYNETYNNTVLRKYDGSHLKFEGYAGIHNPMPHQKDGVWMIAQQMGGILDHIVGSGKSLLMSLAANKMKKMGLIKKPIIIGLKANAEDLARAYKDSFPLSKVLYPKAKDFTPENRKAFFAKMANNDWDAIVMTHDQFGMIEQPKEIQQEIIGQEIAALENDIRTAKANNLSKRDINGLEVRKQNLDSKLNSLSSMRKDPSLKSFDEMGIDFMFVDESQQFKNLQYTTLQKGVSGLGDPMGSAKAFNMLFAIRHLQKMWGGDKGTVFASGTPISNTMVEMYLLFKYLRPNKLAEMGINSFDNWANTFASIGSEIEFGVTNSLKPKVRMREFMNVPEMSAMYREIADVRNDSNLSLKKPKFKQTYRLKTDKEIANGEIVTIDDKKFKAIGKIRGLEKNEYYVSLMAQGADSKLPKSGQIDYEGGKVNYSEVTNSDGLLVNVTPTPAQKAFAKKIQKFAETKNGSYVGIHDMDDKKKKAYMLIATNLAAKMAIDMRLIDPSLPGTEVGKLGVAADTIAEHYKESNSKKGIQLIFSDLGTPKSVNTAENLYDLFESRGIDADTLASIFGAGAKSEKPYYPRAAQLKENIMQHLEYSEDQYNDAVAEANEDNFNIYQDMKNKLIKRGIPANEIVFIHDYKTDAKRKQLFDDARDGKVRVILGSTAKLGTGVNVQNKIVAMHHLDVPWRPSDMEQRNGRGIRQGNDIIRDHYNNELPIYYYATEATLDAYKYQLLDTKQKFIDQGKTGGEDGAREISEGEGDEENGVSFAAMTAMLSGNPVILEKAKVDKQVKELGQSSKAFNEEKYTLKDKIARNKREQKSALDFAAELSKDKELFESNAKRNEKTGEILYNANIEGTNYTERVKAGEKLLQIRSQFIDEYEKKHPRAKTTDYSLSSNLPQSEKIIGNINGFDIAMRMGFGADENNKVSLMPEFSVKSPVSDIVYKWSYTTDPVSLAGHLQREIRDLQSDINLQNKRAATYEKTANDQSKYLESLPQEFPRQKEYNAALERQSKVEATLKEMVKKRLPTSTELEESGKRMQSTRELEALARKGEFDNIYALTEDGDVEAITSKEEYAAAAENEGNRFYQYVEPTQTDETKAGDTLRNLADFIDKGKINKLGGFRSSTGFDAAWDASISVISAALRAGAKVADAIEAGLKHIRESEFYKNLKDKKAFEDQYVNHLNNEYKNFLQKEEPISDNQPPAEPPIVENVESGEDATGFTAVRKEKLKEDIAGAKELLEKRVPKTWNNTYENALSHLQEMYPKKSLYEAMKARVDYFLNKLDKKEIFNPTSEDNAVFNVFRAETQNRINDIDGLDSNNESERQMALLQFEPLQNDLLNISKVVNPEGEAGRAFNMLQSEVKFDPDYGLKVRRMQLLQSKGGNKLTPEENAFAEEKWNQEKELLQREQEIRTQNMRDEFDKKLSDIQKEFEDKFKNNQTTPPKSKEKTSSKLRDIAQGLRTSNEFDKFLKSAKGDIQQAGFSFDLKEAAANAVDHIADLLEKGEKFADAVKDAVSKFKGNLDETDFTKILHNIYNKALLPDKQESLKNIRDYVEESNDTDITNDMVRENLIRDYVNSHIGDVEQKDILKVATNDLKEILPDVTKQKLMEAYLKEGDYKQPTKKELEGSIAESKRQLASITKLEQDIEDLNNLKDLRKRSFKTERAKSEYERQLFDEKRELVKNLNEEKNKVKSSIRNAQNKANKLAEIEANITRAKNDMDLIKTYRNPKRNIDEDILAKNEELKRAIQDNTSDERYQQKKLEQAKKNEIVKQKSFQKRLDNNEFEEREPKPLTDTDAELIKLHKQTTQIEEQFRKKQKELRDKNKSFIDRLGGVARSAYVALLIGKFITFSKVASLAILRPFSEGLTKLTLGKIYNQFFPNISKAALAGGESESLNSVKKGFEAYFINKGEKGIKRMGEKLDAAFEKANKEYLAYKATVDEIKKNNPKAEIPLMEKRLNELRKNNEGAFLAKTGNFVYQFIGSSSLKDAWGALAHRSNEIEKQFGKVEGEKFNEGDVLDKTNYVLGFLGRSHSALKTFSGRFSFAAGFMARLEGAVSKGEDLNSDRVLEIAHESYLDWERGKYQQSNYISDKWNQILHSIDTDLSKHPEWKQYDVATKGILRTEVAITRVPVNILHEAVMEYTLGAIRAARIGSKVVSGIKSNLREEGLVKGTPEFRSALKERVQQMDPEQAATIVRAFRKGGLGIGLYATVLILGGIRFGIFPHLGQKKKKDEALLGKDELNPGQVMFGDDKLGETSSTVIEHIPALWPTFMGLGMAQAYHDEIRKGKSSKEAVEKSLYTHLEIVEGGIPQFKLIAPVQQDVVNTVKKRLTDTGIIDKNLPEGYEGSDAKYPSFKTFMGKGAELPKFSPSLITIKSEDESGNATEKHLTDFDEDVVSKFNKDRKDALRQKADSFLENDVAYVNKYGKASPKKHGDYTEEKSVSELSPSQMKEILSDFGGDATKETKAAFEKSLKENN